MEDLKVYKPSDIKRMSGIKDITLTDLKPFVNIRKQDNYYNFYFEALVPILTNVDVLIPLKMTHIVDIKYVEGNKILLFKRMVFMLAQEVIKCIIFYNYNPEVVLEYFDGESAGAVDKYNIPSRWRGKVLDLDIIRKITYEYLAR